MKTIQKLCALLLAVALVAGMTGCSFMKAPASVEEDRARLEQILADIADNLHPATAGSSLVSARMASDLITWAMTTKMDKKEAAAIVTDWLKVQSPEIRRAFQERIENVASSFGQIARDGAAGLLESAGVEKDYSNLGSAIQDIVRSILASGGVDQ